MRGIYRGLLTFSFAAVAICAWSGASAPAALATVGPVAAYSFDEGEGTTLEDVTGSGHNGEIESAEWTDRGKYGGALEFDGKDDCVTVPDAEELRTTEEFTLETWVKPASPVGDDPIVYKDAWGHVADSLGIGIYSSAKPEGFIGEGEGEFESVAGSAAIEANVWTHLAFTYDGAHMRLYVNGSLAGTQAQAEGPPWGEGPLVIGCNPDYPEFFKGKIDEVRVYDRALNANEVGPDVTPPTQPKAIVARFESEEEENTYVTWVNSSDPPFSNGYPGSGVASYIYRYKLGSGSWSPWLSTSNPAFGLEGTTEGESIWVAVAAKDAAGNTSPTAYAKLHSVVSSLTPENIGEASPGLEVGDPTPHAEPATYPGEDSEEEGKLSDLGPTAEDASSERLCPETILCGKYDWKVAAWYARHWVLAGENNEEVDKHHNHEFPYFGEQGGDCTNFASQVLWAGNMQFLKTEGEDSPDEDLNLSGDGKNPAYQSGPGSWWSAYYYNPFEVINGHGHKIFSFRQSWVRAPVLFRHLMETGLAHVYTSEPIREGDLIFFDLHHGENRERIDHTDIVSAVLPGEAGRNGTILISQHSQAKTVSLHEEFRHVRNTYGERGKDWEAWFVRPAHTKVNIDELELE